MPRCAAADARRRAALPCPALPSPALPSPAPCSRLWAPHTGGCLRSLIPESRDSTGTCPPVTFARFSPNARYVYTAALGSRLQLWEVAPLVPGEDPSNSLARRGLPVARKTYASHVNERFALQIAMAGKGGTKLLLTGSEDHHIYAYNLNTREVVGILRGRPSADAPGTGHCDVVHSVDANNHKSILASAAGTSDCTVKVWRRRSSSGGAA